jgi:hypothetical protein
MAANRYRIVSKCPDLTAFLYENPESNKLQQQHLSSDYQQMLHRHLMLILRSKSSSMLKELMAPRHHSSSNINQNLPAYFTMTSSDRDRKSPLPPQSTVVERTPSSFSCIENLPTEAVVRSQHRSEATLGPQMTPATGDACEGDETCPTVDDEIEVRYITSQGFTISLCVGLLPFLARVFAVFGSSSIPVLFTLSTH